MSGDAPAHGRPVGVIIAGGQARRLGGGDKGLRHVGGHPILALLIARVGPQCAALVLNANGDPGRFRGFAVPVVADADADRGSGPLAGVLAGMAYAATHHPEAEAVLTIPGDCPLPPPDLVARLAAARGADAMTAAAACSGARRHPLAALWPVAARQTVLRAVRVDGERRVEAVLARLAVCWVPWPTDPFDPFTNVNTPADLAEAERCAARADLHDRLDRPGNAAL